MAEWLTEFQKYLAYDNPALIDTDPSRPSVVDEACKGPVAETLACARR
jgi:hypothetical protein